MNVIRHIAPKNPEILKKVFSVKKEFAPVVANSFLTDRPFLKREARQFD